MYAGCVPLTVSILNRSCGLEIGVIQHHPFMGKSAQVACAKNRRQRWLSRLSDFGESGFTVEPAIYLWPCGKHAFFAQEFPEGKLIELAIRLRRR
jgi:hypothetical protein